MDKITHEMRLQNWTELCQQCQERPRGMSIRQWCKEHGIGEKRYYYWQRRVRQEVYQQMDQNLSALSKNQLVSFAELPYTVSADASTETYKPDAVLKKGGLTIEFSNSVSEDLLTRLLGVMDHA